MEQQQYEFNLEMISSMVVSFSIFWGILYIASLERFRDFFHDHNCKQSVVRLIQVWFAATTLFLWSYTVVVCKKWEDIPPTAAALIMGTAALIVWQNRKKNKK